MAAARLVAVVAELLPLRPVAAVEVLLLLPLALLELVVALAHPQHLLFPALLPVLTRLPDLAHKRLLVLADLVVLVAVVPLQHLLRRQSFSAATARISPSPVQPTYEPVPRSR